MRDRPRQGIARPLLGFAALLVFAFTCVEISDDVMRAIDTGFRNVHAVGWCILIGTPLGYSWFGYACFAPRAPQSDRAILWISAAASLLGRASVPILHHSDRQHFIAWAALSGLWLLNLLGAEKLRRTLRHTRRIMNEE